MLVFYWGAGGGVCLGRGEGGGKRGLPFLRILGAVSAETVGVGMIMAVIWKVVCVVLVVVWKSYIRAL